MKQTIFILLVFAGLNVFAQRGGGQLSLFGAANIEGTSLNDEISAMGGAELGLLVMDNFYFGGGLGVALNNLEADPNISSVLPEGASEVIPKREVKYQYLEAFAGSFIFPYSRRDLLVHPFACIAGGISRSCIYKDLSSFETDTYVFLKPMAGAEFKINRMLSLQAGAYYRLVYMSRFDYLDNKSFTKPGGFLKVKFQIISAGNSRARRRPRKVNY